MSSEHFHNGSSFRFSPEQTAKVAQQSNDPSKRDTMNGFPSLVTASSNDFRSEMIRKQKAKARAATALMRQEKKKAKKTKKPAKKKRKTKKKPKTTQAEHKPSGATTPADGQYTFMESANYRFSPDQLAKMEEQENDPSKR